MSETKKPVSNSLLNKAILFLNDNKLTSERNFIGDRNQKGTIEKISGKERKITGVTVIKPWKRETS